MTSEQLTKWALDFIGAVDYDIYKECLNNIEDEGDDDLVDDVIELIETLIEEVRKDVIKKVE